MVMGFAQVADPEHALMLDELFEEYCAENSGLDRVEMSDIQAIILALYLSGATTREQIRAALAGSSDLTDSD